MDFFTEKAFGTKTLIYNREACESQNSKFASVDFEKLFSLLPADAVIACGGDGTLLEAFARYPNRQILGMNFGTRGFLMSDLDAVLGAERFDSLTRNVLNIRYNNEEVLALNELSLRSTTGHVLRVDIHIGDDTLNLMADGCVIATSTGSTAYNSSLSGPILLDDSVFCLTPIAPLSPRAMNPLVFSADSLLELLFPHSRDTEIDVYADGKELFSGSTSLLENISITKSARPLALLIPEGIVPRSPLDIFTLI